MTAGMRRVSDDELQFWLACPSPHTDLENWENHLENYSFGPRKADVLDLDKSWNGLHYLLTGTAYEGQGHSVLNSVLGNASLML